ncbi:hypothetical protein UT300019_29650 [Clostridium sp. CTA-19]
MATLLFFGIDAFVDFSFFPILLKVGPHYSVLATPLNNQFLTVLAPSQVGQVHL